MRIDKFLKVCRVIKRRTIADEACSNGRVSINDKVVKSSNEVKVGDVVSIRFGDKTIKFEVNSILETTKKDQTDGMIKVIE